MSASRLARLLPIMSAQRDMAQQRMAEILAREAECARVLADLDHEEARQAAACQNDPGALDGLALWKIWVSGQRSRTNLRLASLRAEREVQMRKLAVMMGRFDVTEMMVTKLLDDAKKQSQRRLEEDGI